MRHERCGDLYVGPPFLRRGKVAMIHYRRHCHSSPSYTMLPRHGGSGLTIYLNHDVDLLSWWLLCDNAAKTQISGFFSWNIDDTEFIHDRVAVEHVDCH